ncbi:MAG: UDP-N-acetylglucosamine 2-epimerase (non-hydrolyzing) [Desulfobacteraceae bacterium]|nr:UDP-N-acetylglucosamine 2-epimerase (non-hydrolyzing) [Desulfobacteraceae bacterium]
MEKSRRKWILVAAARPNFMKIAPLIRAIHAHNSLNEDDIQPLLVHTGQHYDVNMSDAFFSDLRLPEPDVHLGVGSGGHGEQTGKVLIEFEKVLLKEKPDLVIVVGDVNSTLACTLAAAKLHIPVAHVEAGLRSFDRNMPEEINRLVTDALSDYLFTPSPDGDENLLKEGIPREKIFLVGDIMIDSLLFNLENAKKTDILERLSIKTNQQPGTNNVQSTISNHQSIKPYALLTLHRPSNVDNKTSLGRIIQGLLEVASKIPILFPIHPRTKKQVKLFGMESALEFHASPDLTPEDYHEGDVPKRKIHCFEPLGYLDFLNLMAHAKIVLTDSGGIQEETTVLNIPCITLRDTTERPITLTEGTNVLVHDDPHKIVAEVTKVLEGKARQGTCPSIWDGHTAERIVEVLAKAL